MDAQDEPTSIPGALLLLIVIFIASLFLIGVGLIAAGMHAVQTQHAEITTRGGTVVAEYNGIDAVLHGLGHIAVGTMLLMGGIGMVWQAMAGGVPSREEPQLGFTTSIGKAMGWLSVACLLVAACGFFPPWHLQSLPFYGTGLLLCLYFFRVGSVSLRRWALGLGIVVAVAVFIGVSPGTVVAVPLGFFTWILGVALLAGLVPAVGQRIDKTEMSSSRD